jgi:cleavage and polyadenylation specificity factor subunit 3
MSSNEALRRRVEAVLDMAVTTASSLSEAFSSGVPVASDDGGLTQDKDFGSEKLVVEQGEQTQSTQAAMESVSNDGSKVESNGSQAEGSVA